MMNSKAIRTQGIMLRRLFLNTIILFGVLIGPVNAWGPVNNEAGRILHIGEQLSPERIDLLIDNQIFANDSGHIGIVVFSREDQDFSLKMEKELALFLERDKAGVAVIWEFFLQDSNSTNTNNPALEYPRWHRAEQDSNSIFNLFGIKAFPTIFILNSDFVIQDYIAGFPANTRIHLASLLAKSGQAPPHRTISHKREQKRLNRREHFAFELYKTGNIQGALAQLNRTTPSSSKARLVKVYSLIQLEQYGAAIDSLTTLSSNDYDPGIIPFTNGLILYLRAQYQQAWGKVSDLYLQDTHYELAYLRSLLLQELGKENQAQKEYELARQLAGRELQSSDLFDILR